MGSVFIGYLAGEFSTYELQL